jgi:aminopeptidase N
MGWMTRTRAIGVAGAVTVAVAAALVIVVTPRGERGTPGIAGPSTSATSTPSGTPPAIPTTSTIPGGSVPSTTVTGGITGAESDGDPYFPSSGNGGYDVAGYDLEVNYEPETRALAGVATITAKVGPDPLARFSLDLQPNMTVRRVSLGGSEVGFSRHDAKLVVTPSGALPAGSAISLIVTYDGVPGMIPNVVWVTAGWHPLAGGGGTAIGQPLSASAWYPVNETPDDRATFAVTATVPKGWTAVSNGLPVAAAELPAVRDGHAVFGWRDDQPMASYLSTLSIDRFTMTTDTSSGGIPIINAYSPGTDESVVLGRRIGEYLDFLSLHFGPYPFTSSGAVFLSGQFNFALETQTRPTMPAGFVDEAILVHELAHQWFGNAVTLKDWADLCLNECVASYAQWMWEAKGGVDLDAKYRAEVRAMADVPAFWQRPLVDMGPDNLFTDVYSRGPIALHALRAQIGADKFAEVLLSWIEKYSGRSASFADFEALVSSISGKDESKFLTAWFRGTGIPADEYLWPGNLRP